MDIFDQRYYRINKLFLSWTGQWPYDHPLKRNAILFTIIAISGTQVCAKMCSIYMTYHNTDLLFDSLPAVVANLAVFSKIYNYVGLRDELINLLEHLKLNWSTMTSEEEIIILKKYGEHGRWLTKVYAKFLAIAAGTFLVLPVATRLIFRMGNSSAPRPLPHHVHYFVDNQQFYFPILMHAYVGVGSLIACMIAADTMFIAFVQHVCGLFSIIEYKLERVGEDQGSLNVDPSTDGDTNYSTVCECVKMHNNVLRFVRAMEHFYSRSFLVQAGFNILLTSITTFRAALLIGNVHLVVRMIALTLTPMTHLVAECYQGQQLIDHSLRVRESLYVNAIFVLLISSIAGINSQWYQTSIKTQKLIQFMLLASEAPCLLTAGKLFVISMEFCELVLRTSMSYFTLLRSVG